MNPTYEALLKILGVLVGFSGIILFLLNWRRFKPKDNAEVDHQKAKTVREFAEAKKVEADADVSKAAAQKTFNDIAMGIINRLDEELEDEKKRNAELQLRVNEILAEVRSLQIELDEKTRICNKISQELNEAMLELKKLKNNAE